MLLLSIPHLPLDVNERNTLDIAKKEKKVQCNKKKKGRNLSFLELSFSSTHYSWQRAFLFN